VPLSKGRGKKATQIHQNEEKEETLERKAGGKKKTIKKEHREGKSKKSPGDGNFSKRVKVKEENKFDTT